MRYLSNLVRKIEIFILYVSSKFMLLFFSNIFRARFVSGGEQVIEGGRDAPVTFGSIIERLHLSLCYHN